MRIKTLKRIFSSLLSTGVDNGKVGVDNRKVGIDDEKALKLTNGSVFHKGRQ